MGTRRCTVVRNGSAKSRWEHTKIRGDRYRMSPQTFWFVGGLLVALHLANVIWRRRRARELAERWLAQHNYRVQRMRPLYWSVRPRFRATPFRNNDWAVDFQADIDDMKLGGSGEVRLRVWTDWLGMLEREPEIAWIRMPTMDNGGALTPEMEWENAQMALLRRVSHGDTTLRPAGRDAESRADFDTMVEHILALQRRGLLHCATPIADLRSGAQYSEVADVVLTEEGRRALDRADAAAPPPAFS